MVISAFGKECWLNEDGFARWFKPTTVYINGIGFYDPNMSDEMLYRGGYTYISNAPNCDVSDMYLDYQQKKIYEIFTENTNIVVNIDSTTYQSGLQFAYVLDMYFPNIGAVTNRFITETYVTGFFAAKLQAKTITAEDLGYVTMLTQLFPILKDSPFNPSPGTTWDFPFGRSQIIVPTTRRYYIDDKEIKHYLD